MIINEDRQHFLYSKENMNLHSFFANWKSSPARITVVYLVTGILWVLFSDIVAAAIAPDQAALTKISIYKGWGYIIVTAGLFYWLIRRYVRRLHKNDELLQLAGDMVHVGGWEFDAVTFEGTWTDEVARIHDLDPGQPTNVELGISFYLPESKKEIEEAIIQAVEHAKPYDLELEMLSAKGAHKWVRTIAHPILENGRVTKIRGIFQDITEQKMIEASLKENEERFRSLYENATIGMYRTTPDGQILLCNQALLNMLGYKSFDELAQRDLEAVGYEPGYERSEFRQKIEAQGEVRGFESAWFKRDNSSVYVRESAKAIRDADGEVIYYEGTVEDITERKNYEKALQLENERFMRFTDSNIVGIVIADTVGNILMANDYYLNILGVTRQDFLDGKVQWTRFTPPEWLPADEKAIQELREHGVCEPYEKEYERADGTRVPVYIADAMLPGPGEQVAAFVLDISKRKRAEQEIENLARFPLENPNPVMRVTAEGQLIYANPPSRCLQDMWKCEIGDTIPDEWKNLISESVASASGQMRDVQCNEIIYSLMVVPVAGTGYANLYGRDITERTRADDELKRSNAELEQFAYVASHDLQEPLRAIAGMVQLLQKHYHGKLDDQAHEYIEYTVEAAERMRMLINDLLAYSRVDRIGSQFKKVDIDECLAAALTNLKVALQESGAIVTHDPLPSVLADATQITQVFQNLIGNAIKFRGERPLQVHVGAQKVDNAWRLEVRDNGIGIEPQYFERIFGIFQRLHTRREYPGTGIGLSLCKKIVERHGGRIWVESEIGQGTSFFFTLVNRS